MKYTQESIKEFEDNLSLLGYKKYKENYQSGDYIYWKSFDRQINEDGEKLGGYMVGFNVYDFSKFTQFTDVCNISVSPVFLLGRELGVDRLDIQITDELISVEQFEQFSKKFYDFYLLNKFEK